MAEDQQQIRIHDSELDYDSELTYTYKGKLFTGVAYEEIPGGGISEMSYRDGAQQGIARDWCPSGQLKEETHYRENVLHGRHREFDEDGNTLLEENYEYGILVSSIRRDADGNVQETFEIDVNDPIFDMLTHHRTERRWPIEQ